MDHRRIDGKFFLWYLLRNRRGVVKRFFAGLKPRPTENAEAPDPGIDILKAAFRHLAVSSKGIS